jgi:hypothetical protein
MFPDNKRPPPIYWTVYRLIGEVLRLRGPQNWPWIPPASASLYPRVTANASVAEVRKSESGRETLEGWITGGWTMDDAWAKGAWHSHDSWR